jgi:hypothetical protein
LEGIACSAHTTVPIPTIALSSRDIQAESSFPTIPIRPLRSYLAVLAAIFDVPVERVAGKNEHAPFVLAIVAEFVVPRHARRRVVPVYDRAVHSCNRRTQESMHDPDTNRGCRDPLSVARLGTSTKAVPSAPPTMRRDGETRYGNRAPQLRHRAQAQYTMRRWALRFEIGSELPNRAPPIGPALRSAHCQMVRVTRYT